MKIVNVRNRALKESIKQKLNENTGNFFYENVCLYVSDEDYEIGNYPAYDDKPINDNRNFPQYPLTDYNDGLECYSIVLTPGYYEGACIDFVELDDDMWSMVGGYALESELDRFSFEDGKWIWQDYYHRENDTLEEQIEQQVFDDIIAAFDKEYQPLISEEKVKAAMERYKNKAEGDYGLGSYIMNDDLLGDLWKKLMDKEYDIVKERLEQIKKEYGFRELQIIARFSNGETWYDYKESLIEKYDDKEWVIPVDFFDEDETGDPISKLEREWGLTGVEFLRVYEEGVASAVDVKGSTAELVAFLMAFTGMSEDDALMYIHDFHIEENETLEEAAPTSRKNLTGREYLNVEFPAFTLKYIVEPGRQYDKPDAIWETNTYGDLVADREGLDRLEKYFIEAVKSAAEKAGIKGVPVIGSSRLVPIPDVVHLETKDGVIED